MVKLTHKYDNEETITCKEFVKRYAGEYNKLFSWGDRPSYMDEWEIETDGHPEDLWEQMVLMLFNKENRLNFFSLYNRFPEDLVEGRTDYDDLLNYAVDMMSFIEMVLEFVSKVD